MVITLSHNPDGTVTMVITPYKHSYATQKLWQQDIKIFSNGKQIMQYPFDDENWFFPELETKITTGHTILASSDRFKTIPSYDDIVAMGFVITVRKASGKFFKGQKVQYLLRKRSALLFDIGFIPKNHYVEYDFVEKRIRLKGKNSDGRWVSVHDSFKKRPYNVKDNPFDFNKPIQNYETFLKNYSPIEVEETSSEVIIPEIPIMISEDGRLICIPEQRDTPIIGITGERRSGKTLFLHGINDRVVNKWHKKSIMVNDVQGETGTWCLPWNADQPIKKLISLSRIGEITQPLPICYFYQKTNDLKSKFNEMSFEVSMPFRDTMVNYERFLHGKPEWQFANSGTYFRNLILDDDGKEKDGGLCSCESNEDIKNLIFKQEEKELQEEIRGQVIVRKYIGYAIENDKVRYKIWNVMKDVVNTQLFDITNKIPAKWEIELPDGKYSYYPWIACILAGIQPTFVTTNLRGKHYFPQWFNFVMNSLFDFQKEDKLSIRNKHELYVFIPELQGISGDEKVKNTLNKIVNESGMARISIVYDTQNSEKIPDDIKLNTNYVFAFRQKKQQANLISKDFDLLNYKEKELIKLNKFECLAIGKFVAYDTDGNKEMISDEPIKGTILPSVSMHQAPKLMGDE